MKTSRFLLACTAAVVISVTGSGLLQAQSETLPPSGEKVFRMGEFLRGTTQKTRSLRRTTEFLDVDRLDRQLQVAILVDGTESMEAELESLQNNLRFFVRGLQEVKQDPVPIISVAVIIYRDTDAPAGPVESVIGKFETDLSAVERELTRLHPETGAPYFREAIDQGLHHTLTQLDWLPTSEEGISRWIIIAGDAPPYPEGTDFRKHTNEELIKIAKEKQIAIYGMATGSGFLQIGRDKEALRAAAEQERPDFRTFLGELAQATGGHTVDTLDPNAIRYWMTHQQVMTPITEEDIEAVRNRGQATTEDVGQLRIAVLPHLPLDSMSFASDAPEVVIAAHLRDRLSRLGGVDVVPPTEVEKAFANLEVDATKPEKTLSKLYRELHAEYVIWGTQKTNLDFLVIETGLYKGLDGSLLAGVSESIKPISEEGRLMVINSLFKQLCTESAQSLTQRMKLAHAEVFQKSSTDAELEQVLMAPLANDYRAQSAILSGLDQLEQSLAYVKDDKAVAEGRDPAADSLRSAIAHLEEALMFEPKSPYAHLLMADCYHNLSRQQTATDEMAKFSEHLDMAYHGLEELPSDADPIQLEIQAQYSLLITKDIDAAIRHYEELAGRSDGKGNRFDLRSHWMLAGIHLGEWDAISYGWEQVDPDRARNHILTILAFWKDSPEARFYENCIRNSAGEYLDVPVGNSQLAQTY